MWRNFKYSFRLLGIGWTLARHDALFVFDALNLPWFLLLPARLIPTRDRKRARGQRLSRALQALGPSFIKAGQSLSTRPDLIGEDIATGLTELQDRLPPFPTAIAKRTVEEQLGLPLEVLFSEFNNEPVAAASIAQVHFARLPDGREVAVKILRPNIERAFQRDLDLMYWLAGQVARRMPQYRRLKPLEVVETFASTIRIELDLRFEAAAADELRENTKQDPDFYVPTVEWDLTARRVLVTERIRGISAGDVEAITAAGLDRTKIMEASAKAFFNQVFRDGFFHADMHPGNLFVLPDGRLAPVDFGIMGRIDHESQLLLAQILWSFLNGDYMRVAELHREAGYIPQHVNLELFAQACRAVGSPIQGKAMNEISVGRLFGQLLAIAQMFEMEAQPHLILLQKTMVTAEGLGRAMNPNVNMWQLSEPLIRDWAESHLSARARIKSHLKTAGELLRDAPRVLKQFEHYLEVKAGQPLPPPANTTIIVPPQQRFFAFSGWLVALIVAAFMLFAD